MRHKKPTVTTLAALSAGTLLALSACSGTTSNSNQSAESGDEAEASEAGQVTLQTWGDTSFAELQGTTYNETYPDQKIDLKVVAAGQSDVESLEAFRLTLASGQNIPDILQINYSQLPEFAEAGVLADIGEYVEPYVDGLTSAGQQLMQYEGQYLSFPYEVKSKIWLYRKDLFEQAGIDVTAVKTQEEFVEAGKALQSEFPDSYIWNLGPAPAPYNWGMIVSGNGATFSTKDPCEIVVGTDPGLAEAFQTIYDLRESGVVNREIDDWTPEWQAGLADGTIASTLAAAWLPSFLVEYAPDLAGKWGVTTWPEIGGATGGSEGAGSVFVITEASKNKEAAAKFLSGTLIDPKGTMAYAEARGGVWLPSVTEVLESDFMQQSDYFGPELVQAFLASSEKFSIFPYDPAAGTETNALADQMIEYLASGQPDPKPFLEAAQAELAAKVGCPWDN